MLHKYKIDYTLDSIHTKAGTKRLKCVKNQH
jgi:hypothetical protein